MLYCLITVKINGLNFFSNYEVCTISLAALEQVVEISLGDCGEEEVMVYGSVHLTYITSALEQEERCPKMSCSLYCLCK